MLRQQLPVHSPITLQSIWKAAEEAIRAGSDAQNDLRVLLAQEYAAEHTLLFGSGTQALQVAIRLALRQTGDSPVALPAFSCFDVGAAAVGARAQIRLYDLDPNTLGPDLDSLARVLDRGTRVVVVAPLYGFPVDWASMDGVLALHDAVAIEDAAQGYQARWRGRPVGTLGPMSVLSFGRGKGWTGGAGGALLLRGTGARDVARLSLDRRGLLDELRVLGMLTAQWLFGRPAIYWLPTAVPWLGLGETIYRDPTPPRPMTLAAPACLAALREAAAREAAARRKNGRLLMAALGSHTQVRIVHIHRDAEPGFLRLPVRLPRGLAGFENPQQALRLGILPSHPSVLAGIPQVRARLDRLDDRWPGGEELSRSLFTVPTHSLLTERERREVTGMLQRYRA